LKQDHPSHTGVSLIVDEDDEVDERLGIGLLATNGSKVTLGRGYMTTPPPSDEPVYCSHTGTRFSP
jgi:hypothetical protein